MINISIMIYSKCSINDKVSQISIKKNPQYEYAFFHVIILFMLNDRVSVFLYPI